MKYSKAEKDEARARLLAWLKPGDAVHTILRHCSRSGMSREIGVVLLPRKGRDYVLHPNHAVAVLLGERRGKRDGVIVGGCGMDMGFHIVYSLSQALFPSGYGCIGEGCLSNDHFNGDRDYTKHGAGLPRFAKGANVYTDAPLSWSKSGYIHWHRGGGYALRHVWL